MFGKILSSTLKLVTLPIDAVEIAADLVTGGDGDRKDLEQIAPLPSKLRDKVADVMEDID